MLATLRRTIRPGSVVPALLLAACYGENIGGPGPGPNSPPLGTAATYGILAGSTVTCAGPGRINADLGLWPGKDMTGFPACTILGTTNMANAVAEAAQDQLTSTYEALAGMACGTRLSSDLGGRTLAPGVYCATASQRLTGNVTLDGTGNPNATFVIQMVGGLTMAGAVELIDGAQAKNVWWQIGGSAAIAPGSAMQGNVVAYAAITLDDDATLHGRALARYGAVILGRNVTITLP